MGKKIAKILMTRDEIQAMCERLGRQITADYAGKEVVMIAVLKGSVIFLADLVRQIQVPLRLEFMSVSSYQGTKSSGVVRIIKDVDEDIQGKHVILVEDVVDTGLTLAHLRELLQTRQPASIRVCTAFDKPERRVKDVPVEYVGKVLPDAFVVGYGLDYNQAYRELPDLAILVDSEEKEDA